MTAPLAPPPFASSLDAALWWVRVVPVVPLAPSLTNGPRPIVRWKEDGPLRTESEVREFWAKNPRAQIAVVLGPTTDGRFLGAVDTDLKNRKDGMPEPPAGFIGKYRHSTKSGGFHDLFFYRTAPPETVARRSIGVGGFVDVLLDGLLVVPPTHFAEAKEYRVTREGEIPEFEAVGLALDPAAPWLRQAWKDHRPKAATTGRPDDKEPILEGARRATLLSRAGKLRDLGAGADAILTDLREYNDRRCAPPLPDAELAELARDVAKRYEPTREPVPAREDGRRSRDGPPKGPPAADLLVEIARAKADLFRDGEGEVYATVTRTDGRTETHRLRSSGFRRWLDREYYNRHRKAPPSDAMSTARGTIESLAAYEGAVRSVALRVGFEGGCLYIDLGDDARRVVRVAPSGWGILDSSPVRFIRGKGMGPLPIPDHGGSLLDLLPFLNAKEPTEPHFVLAVAWLLGTFHPSGPYPVLAINGEQGAGKSNGTVRLKALGDPATPPHRAAPKEPRDLAVAGRGSWVLAFDNLSTIPDWLSDAICRLSTGGGFATRGLYTDDEEVVFSGKRPVVFNGIVPVAASADLRDRCLLVTWPSMKTAKTEKKLDPAFKTAAPGIFGAILDALVAALAGQEAIAEEYAGRLPRMGDFFCWVVAAESALPWPRGTFERIYAESRSAGAEIAVSESPVALAILALLQAEPTFEGTATALLSRLGVYATPPIQPNAKPPLGWPKTPSSLSGDLRRMAPDLRVEGVSVEFPEGSRKRGRRFRIAYHPVESRDSSSPASPRPHPIEELGDGVGDGVGDAPIAEAVPLSSSAVGEPGIAVGDGGDGKSRPLSAPRPADPPASGSEARRLAREGFDQGAREEGADP